MPAFNIGTRGLVYFHVRLRTGERDLHSGVFGGAALNALHALMQHARRRSWRMPDELRSGIAPPTDEERAGWAELDLGRRPCSTSRAPGRATSAPPRSSTSRTLAGPAVDVHGIVGGSPMLQKTVLPVEAEANVSIRLAPGQDVGGDRARVRAPPARGRARGRASSRSSAGRRRPPASSRPTRRRCGSRQDAFERVLGTRPLLLRSGGTLPIVPALADKGIPTILTGFELPEGTSTRRTSGCSSATSRSGSQAVARDCSSRFADALALAPTSCDGRVVVLLGTSHSWPNWRIASMIGRSAAPFAVSSYSTRGGDSA